MNRAVGQIRSIYLHSGRRVAGLRRDPQTVFQTPLGAAYKANDASLSEIKKFLEPKYSVPDDMALQVLTHKSFANGIAAYNEKLAAVGLKVVNLALLKFVVEQPTDNELAINGKNLDVIGSPMAKELAGRKALGIFVKNNHLNKNLFWKLYNHLLSFEQSGEMKVSAQMIYALVGAVTHVHGKNVAEEFVTEKLLLGTHSLQAITAEILNQA